MRYFVFILWWVWSAHYYVDVASLGIYTGCPWWHCLTYGLIHRNIIHLMANTALMCFYWDRCIRHYNKAVVIPVIAAATALAGFLAATSLPTIGASGIVFAMVGVATAKMSRRLIVRITCILTLTFIATGVAARNVNTALHIYAFISTFIPCYLLRRYI